MQIHIGSSGQPSALLETLNFKGELQLFYKIVLGLGKTNSQDQFPAIH
jgi:hypothetical protein